MDAINQDLLKNKEVLEEINRHRWIESEKTGHDIGFEAAAQDWLNRFSTKWMQYHFPQKSQQLQPQKQQQPPKIKSVSEKTTAKEKVQSPQAAPNGRKTRRASSYF